MKRVNKEYKIAIITANPRIMPSRGLVRINDFIHARNKTMMSARTRETAICIMPKPVLFWLFKRKKKVRNIKK